MGYVIWDTETCRPATRRVYQTLKRATKELSKLADAAQNWSRYFVKKV